MKLRHKIPAILSSLLLGAHFLRGSHLPGVVLCLMLPFLLLFKRNWAIRILQILLAVGSLVWIKTTASILGIRLSMGLPWLRMVLILTTVSIFTLIAACLLKIDKNYSKSGDNYSVTAFLSTSFLLLIVQFKVHPPMLLLERFFRGWGIVEILIISIYAAFIIEKMSVSSFTPLWRRRIWLFFSFVFFTQVFLGLVSFQQFLANGKLHLPVPAMIIGGPLFRGNGFFMPILFITTLILVGPAWCSHLCYIGVWDNISADAKKHPLSLPSWASKYGQVITLFIVVISAVCLRMAGVSVFIATLLGGLFGIIGIVIMVAVSRKLGIMAHCTMWCPMGLIANIFGKLNPTRIKIGEKCTDCNICTLSCRYNALNRDDIKRRHPGFKCTLCGDCIKSCPYGQLQYTFPGLDSKTARMVFITIIVTLHAVFLAVARM